MEEIIVSFTSYPARIETISKIIDSIANQTILPDKIVLYLSTEEFEDYDNFPDLEEYRKYGFEIRWCNENLRSHKKYFYAMQEFPNDIVITIDDDVIYSKTLIEDLIKGHQQCPNAVIARRTHLITWLDNENIASYDDWYGECINYFNEPRMDLVAVGVDGILYPPHRLPKETFNREMCMKHCKYADDLWLKTMELLNKVPVMLVRKGEDDRYIDQYIKNGLYKEHNGNGGNDIQLLNVMKVYNDRDVLKKRIQKDGLLLKNNALTMKNIGMEKLVTELINDISKKDGILIFGAGYVANLLYHALDYYNLIDRIKGFIVSDVQKNPQFLHEIKVTQYVEYRDDEWDIWVALMPEKQEEIIELLLASGIDASRIKRITGINIAALRFISESHFNSAEYWNNRYAKGGNSGTGSYNKLAEFKADTINSFVRMNGINSVIEWGCGDGNQLGLAEYSKYIGYDVAENAIKMCKERFHNDKTKTFVWCGKETFENEVKADLAISLDVIYHLVEEDVYDVYMKRLFDSSNKYVCIYASNYDMQTAKHVKHRRFTDWVEKNMREQWELKKIIKNIYPYDEERPDETSPSDFYFYEKLGN